MNTVSNQKVISVITTTVAIMAFTCVVTICFLSYLSIQIPPELNTLAATFGGALTGMLVKTSPTTATPATEATIGASTPVTVVNAPSDPVPTTET